MTLIDRTVASMMSKFGTTAYIVVTTQEYYDPSASENIVTTVDYEVNAMFFDYMRKTEGLGMQNNTLIQSGDKQVFVQPPQKALNGIPLPHLLPNKDKLKVGDKIYKIVSLQQHNTSMTTDGCVLYELYVRE